LYHGAPLTPAAAVMLVAGAIATLYAVQIVLGGLGVGRLVASAISDTVVIALVLIFARGRKLTLADLGVRRTSARFLVSAVLLGISMWYVTFLVVELVQPPADPEQLEKLNDLVVQLPFVPTLVAFTIFPAVAEELVFRGVLTRSLAPRFSRGVGIVISAAVFSLYHLFPPQMVSTFLLGLVLGLLTVRARSIVPAIIVHLLNNAIAIVLARKEVPALDAWLTAQPVATLAVSLVLVASGIALASKGAK
jgi:membrane protease YdiL (CAAX protease family)